MGVAELVDVFHPLLRVRQHLRCVKVDPIFHRLRQTAVILLKNESSNPSSLNKYTLVFGHVGMRLGTKHFADLNLGEKSRRAAFGALEVVVGESRLLQMRVFWLNAKRLRVSVCTGGSSARLVEENSRAVAERL